MTSPSGGTPWVGPRPVPAPPGAGPRPVPGPPGPRPGPVPGAAAVPAGSAVPAAVVPAGSAVPAAVVPAETAETVTGAAGPAENQPAAGAPGGPTGHPAVDAALQQLDRAAGLPAADQVPAYEATHRALQQTLATIDQA